MQIEIRAYSMKQITVNVQCWGYLMASNQKPTFKMQATAVPNLGT